MPCHCIKSGIFVPSCHRTVLRPPSAYTRNKPSNRIIMKQSIVTGMGEALWDMLPEGKKIGGAPANFAYHISQFGIDSRVVSAVGKDMAGSELLENLRDKSLKGLIEKTDFPTGSVEVEVDEKGIPCYNIREDVAWDHIPFTPQTAELARQTQAVCFGSLGPTASRLTLHHPPVSSTPCRTGTSNTRYSTSTSGKVSTHRRLSPPVCKSATFLKSTTKNSTS